MPGGCALAGLANGREFAKCPWSHAACVSWKFSGPHSRARVRDALLHAYILGCASRAFVCQPRNYDSPEIKAGRLARNERQCSKL